MAQTIEKAREAIQIADEHWKNIQRSLREIAKGVEQIKKFKSISIPPASLAYDSIKRFTKDKNKKGSLISVAFDKTNLEAGLDELSKTTDNPELRNRISELKNEYAEAQKDFFNDAFEKIDKVHDHFHYMIREGGNNDRMKKGIPGTPNPKLEVIDAEAQTIQKILAEVEANVNALQEKLAEIRKVLEI